jgi:hypothetical protein
MLCLDCVSQPTFHPLLSSLSALDFLRSRTIYDSQFLFSIISIPSCMIQYVVYAYMKTLWDWECTLRSFKLSTQSELFVCLMTWVISICFHIMNWKCLGCDRAFDTSKGLDIHRSSCKKFSTTTRSLLSKRVQWLDRPDASKIAWTDSESKQGGLDASLADKQTTSQVSNQPGHGGPPSVSQAIIYKYATVTRVRRSWCI